MSAIDVEGVLSAVKKVRGGVAVSHNKNTADMKTVRNTVAGKSCAADAAAHRSAVHSDGQGW